MNNCAMGRRLIAVTIAAFLAPGCASAHPSPDTNDGTEATVSDVVEQLQDALRQANAALGKDKDEIPPFKSADLTLETGLVKESDISFKLVVLSAERKWSQDTSQTITITLGPPPPLRSLTETPMNLTDSLAGAIVSVARGLSAVRPSTDRLHSQKLLVEVAFTVERNFSGGPKVTLKPVEAGAEWSQTKKATQKVAVTFEEPEKKSASGAKH
jgi:hypothetical protein